MLKVTQQEKNGATSHAGLSDPAPSPMAVATSCQAEAQRQAREQGLWFLGGGRDGGSHMASSLFPRAAWRGCRDA